MRWKFFMPAVVITALIVLFNIFLLDTYIKKAIVASGEMVFGAKVEVGSVKTKFKTMSVSISGMTVASRGDAWKNLFEVKSLRFSMQPLPLLTKKFIVEEMTADGIQWGTERSASGALPPKKEKKYKKAAEKEKKDGMMAKLFNSIAEKGKKEIQALPAADTVKNLQAELGSLSLDKAVDLVDLSSLGEIESMKNDLAQKYAQYDQQVKALALGDNLKEAQTALTELSGARLASIEDAQALQGKIENINRIKAKLDAEIAQVAALKEKAVADFGDEKEMVKKLNELKDKDCRAVMDKLKLPNLTVDSMAKSLFGPVWIGRVDQVLHYVALARKYMPPPKKKEEKKVVKTRLKGRDIAFPLKDRQPDFLIKRILIAGSTGGPGKEGEPLDFKGEVSDITSDPVLVGRPTRVRLNGIKDNKTLEIAGILDHTQEIPVDKFTISYAGLTAAEMNLPSSEYLPSFAQGQGKVASAFTLSGENIEAGIGLLISGVGAPSVEHVANPELQSLVTGLWAGIDSISVDASLKGTFDDINMSVSSNIDKILAERMAKLFGEKLKEIQGRIKADIERLTGEKKQELMREYASHRDELKKQYDDKQKELLGKRNELESLTKKKENEIKDQADAEKRKVQEQLEAEKRKAQEQLDQEKKKAEEELKKKAADQLKNLFK